jgi:hypothetical protein
VGADDLLAQACTEGEGFQLAEPGGGVGQVVSDPHPAQGVEDVHGDPAVGVRVTAAALAGVLQPHDGGADVTVAQVDQCQSVLGQRLPARICEMAGERVGVL